MFYIKRKTIQSLKSLVIIVTMSVCFGAAEEKSYLTRYAGLINSSNLNQRAQGSRTDLEVIKEEYKVVIEEEKGTITTQLTTYREEIAEIGNPQVGIINEEEKIDKEIRRLGTLNEALRGMGDTLVSLYDDQITTFEDAEIKSTPDLFRSQTDKIRESTVRRRELIAAHPEIYTERDLPLEPKQIGFSVDGGGIKGLIPALGIRQIEEITGRRIYELVDYVSGTSIGGINALGITTAKPIDGLPYSGNELVEMFRDHKTTIFSQGIFPAFQCKYGKEGIESVIGQFFGDQTLSATCKPVLVTATTMDGEPFYFRTHTALTDQRHDYFIKDVARSTSAAPTFFPSHKLKSLHPWSYDIELMDGGLWCNNPSLMLYHDMENLYQVAQENCAIVSLGTGENPPSILPGRAGYIHVPQLIDGIFLSNNKAVNTAMSTKLGEKYWRVQPPLPIKADLDTVADEVLDYLEVCAESQFEVIESAARFMVHNFDLRREI